VLLDNLLDLPLFNVLSLVLLHEEDDLGTAAKGLAVVRPDGEGASGRRLPDLLLVIVVLGVDDHLVRDEVGGVEADAKLTDHGDVCSGLKRLHEGLCSGLGDGTEVVDEVGLSHADARVNDGDGLALLVGDDLDEELLLGVELGGIGEALISDLVQGIGAVGNQLAEEDFFVGVEGVDDEGHQLGNLCLEGEGFSLVCHL